MMYASLRKEWVLGSAHFWLNIPTKGWKLLSAKFLAASSYMLVSLGFTFLIIYLFLQRSMVLFTEPNQLAIQLFQSSWWVLFFGIFIGAMRLGAAITFIYVMSKSIQKWGWFLAVTILSASSWIWFKMQQTAVYQTLTHWGVVMSSDDIIGSVFVESNGTITVEAMEDFIYLGATVVELIIIIVLIYISSWILDNKTNV